MIIGGALFVAFALSLNLVLIFRWLPPPTSMVMIEDRIERLFKKGLQPSVNYRWTPLESISPHLPLAVIAAEDQKFLDHWGFDVEAIEKAMETNRKGRRLRGASSISQQVAKNLFLWSDRSYLRKGLETYMTLLIEALWPKKRILEVYVNIAEFGDGIYGASAAAEKLFGKLPSTLTQREAARLAAVLPNPKKMSAKNPSVYVRQRERWIQGQMRQLGGVGYLGDL